MASIIRIKRSDIAGNPNVLAAGELAYSSLPDNGSNGGDRLYIGTGTETAGNAVNHVIIGGKYYTGLIDASGAGGVLNTTAKSVPVLSSSGTIDQWLVGNLKLSGNSLVSTNSNGDISLTPNGTGKTIIGNLFVGDSSTSLAEYIFDQVGGTVTQGTGILVVYDDAANTATISVDSTTVLTTTGTQNVTNKSLDDTSTFFFNTTDPTKKLKFQLSQIATGTVGTIVPADGNTTLQAGTMAIVGGKLSQFAATTSSELAGVISDETGTGSLVFANSPVLVSPTLGNATVTSIIGSAGNLTIAAASGNNSVVLDPAGTGTVDVSGARITSVADPIAAQDAATKAYVDAVKTGLNIKDAVRAATTVALSAAYSNGTAGVGATLTNAGSPAVLVLDGVALTVGDRVLVKNQTTATENGIYVVTDIGAGLPNAVNWVLTRASDFDQSAAGEIGGGDFVFVQEGATNADSGFVVTTDGPITVGTTSISWVQFSGAGQITAGAGLVKTGSVLDIVGTANRIVANADSIDIASSYVGQSSITTLGTIGTGTWQGTVISPTYGGTGVNNGSNTITLGGNFTTNGAYNIVLTATAASTVTLPISGTLATLAGSETLTNKTLTSPVINSGSLSGVLSGTATFSGLITFSNTTDATTTNNAAVVLAGGLGVAKSLYVGTNVIGSGAATSYLDAFTIDGGIY